jgi:hypothetical protein
MVFCRRGVAHAAGQYSGRAALFGEIAFLKVATADCHGCDGSTRIFRDNPSHP